MTNKYDDEDDVKSLRQSCNGLDDHMRLNH